MLSACQADSVNLLPDNTLAAEVSPTAIATTTRIWFPATSTPTFRPQEAGTPTPDSSPDFGILLVDEDFSNPNDWLHGPYAGGNVAYGTNTLNLAVAAPRSYLTSFRKDTYFNDMYMEVTITPNLCSPSDTYGLIFWSANDTNYHQLTFNCAGLYAVEKVKNGRATSLLNWTPSSQLPRGGFSPFRAGLWVGGGLVRIYLNGSFQSEIYLPAGTGGVGVFAESASGPAMNISYSDMQIYGVTSAQYPPTPTITPTPTKKPYPTQPTP